MGLFDGVEAGWNSFKNKELKAVQDAWATVYIDKPKEIVETTIIEPIKTEVLDYVKQDPIKAAEVVKDPVPQVIDQLVTLNEETNPYIQGLKESTQPIWERESTVKILGEDGADKLQDALNPARWGENAINDLGVSDTTKESLKKYLPIALAGGAALLILSSFK